MPALKIGPALGLGAAALFGLSAPATKLLVGAVDPWLLAGLLYLGSGAGLGSYVLVRRVGRRRANQAALTRRDAPRLGGAILAGGVLGPLLLVFGLARAGAAQSALLLNLEGVFTALLAWVVFREHCHVRIVGGMAAITAGAMTLAWEGSRLAGLDGSSLLIAGACLAWAIDNNLTRGIAGADPVKTAALKGAVAGTVNVAIALGRGAAWPPATAALGAGLVGLLGYGTSLVLFILALRHLGTSRTGAYFSTAPFLGALGALLGLGEPLTVPLCVAAALMGLGVWLHLTERHDHEHVHETFEHDHAHRHDDHHEHAHAPGTPPGEPHTHRHLHASLRHQHPHYPDLHHRHEH